MRAPAAPALALVIVACGSPAPPSPPPEVALVPHDELTHVGPVGTGANRCDVALYAWDGRSCRFQLSHCALAGDRVVCASLADERTVACGATADACGQAVRCTCPEGAAPHVIDAPGTWHVRPTDRGATTTSGGCTATVTRIEGGAEPAPCIFDVRECDPAGRCVDRRQMMSCGVRSEICGRPMRCDCEGAITDAARAAACAAPCADARAVVRVYRGADGQVARLEVEPSPGACSHPPTTILDAAGDVVGVLASEPAVPGSPERAAAARRRRELLLGLESAESFSCAQ